MAVIDRINALGRFSLFRWQGAVHLAWPIIWVTRWVFDWPPAGYENWPIDAQQATRNLIQGGYGLVFAGWLAATLTPVAGISNRQTRFVAIAGCGVLVGSGIVTAFIDLASGIASMTQYPPPGIQAIVWTTVRVVGVPVMCGSFPIVWYLVGERVRVHPLFRRWFASGQGATGGFMTGHEIRKYTRPLPLRLE